MSADPRSLRARRIVVIAPHPDDEALGCGGLIASFASEGRDVHVVFITDGGASHPGSATWPRERLARQRRAEAVDALDQLGLPAIAGIFLDLSDADMPALGSASGLAAIAALTKVFIQLRPELVLLPWRRDPHCDHRHSWLLAHAALARASLSPATLEYSVWLDEFGGEGDHPSMTEAERIGFDISAVLSAKRSAIAAHLTQTSTLIDDDPTAFRLTSETIARLSGPIETYWRPLS